MRAEAAIRTLRDVESVSIQGEGEAIKEIHVLSRSNRAPKQIVRDIQTVLRARFNRSIDYRVVSVAYLGADTASSAAFAPPSPAMSAAPNGTPPASDGGQTASSPLPPSTSEAPLAAVATLTATAAAEPDMRSTGVGPPVVAPAPAPAAVTVPATAATAAAAHLPANSPGEPARSPVAERIRFGSVNLFVSGPRTQAQVELRWRGLPRLGSAAGFSTRDGANRLVAEATLAAVGELLAEDLALEIHEAEFLRLGKKRAAVVSVSLLVGRQEKLLIGSCVVEQDLQQAVVCATLAAVNRLVAGLRPKEPTEYLLRPTSAQ